jgi:hypothetical protein
MHTQSELIEGYGKINNAVGGDYEFTCGNGILYGKNLTNGLKIQLAQRRGFSRKFTPDDGIQGYALVDFICGKFNLMGIPADKADEAMTHFAQQIKESLAHNKSHGDR